MMADPTTEYALLAAGSRENDLVNLRNQRVRFMYNFGAGGGAMVLQRQATRNLFLGVSAFTDGSLSEAVLMSQQPDATGNEQESPGDLRGKLDVLQPDFMAERLNDTSLANFVRVMCDAVEQAA